MGESWQCARCGGELDGPEDKPPCVDAPTGVADKRCLPTLLKVQATGALRANGGKPLLHLIPPEPLLDLAAVLTRGAKKYAPRNWERGLTFSSTYDSLQRHLLKWWSGHDIDDESGLHHLAHALCNVVFLLTFVRRIERGKLPKELDDRPKDPC